MHYVYTRHIQTHTYTHSRARTTYIHTRIHTFIHDTKAATSLSFHAIHIRRYLRSIEAIQWSQGHRRAVLVIDLRISCTVELQRIVLVKGRLGTLRPVTFEKLIPWMLIVLRESRKSENTTWTNVNGIKMSRKQSEALRYRKSRGYRSFIKLSVGFRGSEVLGIVKFLKILWDLKKFQKVESYL